MFYMNNNNNDISITIFINLFIFNSFFVNQF